MHVLAEAFHYSCSACDGPMLFTDGRIASCRTMKCRLYDYPVEIPKQAVEVLPVPGMQVIRSHGGMIGVPLAIAATLVQYIKNDGFGIRNGDTFEFAGKRYIALRDELLKPA